MTNIHESEAKVPVQVVIETKSNTGQIAGILGVVFWILWIVVLAIAFFPLTILMATIAISKKSYLLGVISLILAIVIFATSPSLWVLKVAIENLYTTSGNVKTVANQVVTEEY